MKACLWVIEALVGSSDRAEGKWVPLWNAVPRTTAPTRKQVAEFIREQREQLLTYRQCDLYVKFRPAKYQRVSR